MANSTITLIYNSTILTMDSQDSEAKAMAVYGDRILAVGTEDEVRSEIARYVQDNSSNQSESYEVEEQDVGGACVVPGFIDVHLHPGLCIYFKSLLQLTGVKSYAEMGQRLQEGDTSNPAGEWLLAVDLMEDVFDDPAERHFPDRYLLDQYCPDRPLIVLRHDSHICGVTSVALQIMEINASNLLEKTPAGGDILADSSGDPVGIFRESAVGLALEHISTPDFDQIKEGARRFCEELASFGITTCGGILQSEAEGPGGKAANVELPLLQVAIREGLLEQDFVFYIITRRPKQLKQLQKSFAKLDNGENRFVVGGIKVFADGDFGASTACMLEPFADATDGNVGYMVNEDAELRRLFQGALDLGFQVACHVIGDKGNRIVLNIYRDLLGNSGQGRLCRIEHASVLTPDTIADAAKLGVVLACQPAFINSEYTWLEPRLGPERCKWTYPFRSILDAGAMLAGASDAPIESADVMKGISACVTRNGFVPEQRISVMEALRVFTWNAAYALRQEDVKGSIEPGKLADFVILDVDPRVVPPTELSKVGIRATYHRGKKIFPQD
ncbi:MAG TPA: amidohydrolase [Candidatus Lokiarchaeia archaeon]|nr:amidohydrolase [Candidatus Lokiarchaeia archaeon]